MGIQLIVVVFFLLGHRDINLDGKGPKMALRAPPPLPKRTQGVLASQLVVCGGVSPVTASLTHFSVLPTSHFDIGRRRRLAPTL